MSTGDFVSDLSENLPRKRRLTAQTDNLRFAVSSCVFGYPESISNVSSPCPVACGTIEPAVKSDIEDPNYDDLNSWCDSTDFADNVINTCEFCYNLTTNQIYLANCKHLIPTSLSVPAPAPKRNILTFQSSNPSATTATSQQPAAPNSPSPPPESSQNPSSHPACPSQHQAPAPPT